MGWDEKTRRRSSPWFGRCEMTESESSYTVTSKAPGLWPRDQASSHPRHTILSAVCGSLPELVIRQVSSFSALTRTNTKQGQHGGRGCGTFGARAAANCEVAGKEDLRQGSCSCLAPIMVSQATTSAVFFPTVCARDGPWQGSPGSARMASGRPWLPGRNPSTLSSCCMGPREDPNERAGKWARSFQVSPARVNGYFGDGGRAWGHPVSCTQVPSLGLLGGRSCTAVRRGGRGATRSPSSWQRKHALSRRAGWKAKDLPYVPSSGHDVLARQAAEGLAFLFLKSYELLSYLPY